jgi:hypothetical protein
MGGGNSIAVLAVAFALVVTALKPNNGIMWPMLKVTHAVGAFSLKIVTSYYLW